MKSVDEWVDSIVSDKYETHDMIHTDLGDCVKITVLKDLIEKVQTDVYISLKEKYKL